MDLNDPITFWVLAGMAAMLCIALWRIVLAVGSLAFCVTLVVAVWKWAYHMAWGN